MKKFKWITTLTLAAVIGSAAVTGTLAWYTANDEITNTFTVGNIEMTLTETKIGTENEMTSEDQQYKIVPGVDIKKDPTVTIQANSEDCYVFVQVLDSLTDVDGISIEAYGDKWELKDANSHIYQYKFAEGDKAYVVPKSDKDTTLQAVFETIKVDGYLVTPDVLGGIGESDRIEVKVYAHQAEGVTKENAIAAAKKHFAAR